MIGQQAWQIDWIRISPVKGWYRVQSGEGTLGERRSRQPKPHLSGPSVGETGQTSETNEVARQQLDDQRQGEMLASREALR